MSEKTEMSGCEHLRRRLGEVLEGELEPEALAHLHTCPRCRLLVDELSAIDRAAHELPQHEPSAGLWERIRRVAETEGLWKEPWSDRLGRRLGLFQPVAFSPAFSAAVVVLLLAAGLLVGLPNLEVSPVPEALPSRVEVARSELALAPDYGERYAKHLEHIAADVEEEFAPADTPLVRVAHSNLETLDRFIQQCQVRLVQYPQDGFTRDELNRLYQQKTTLLQAMLDPDWQTSVR